MTAKEETATAVARYRRAKSARGAWESHWQDCYDHVLPGRDLLAGQSGGGRRSDRLFDATASDAADQLAASLLAQLTPPWSRWFALRPGPDTPPSLMAARGEILDRATDRLHAHFDRANFAVEVHQAYLDLVVAGTACLLFEEAPLGEASAFRFAALPLADVVLEEGASGRLDTVYRRFEANLAELARRYPKATLPRSVTERGAEDPDLRFGVIEAVAPSTAGYGFEAWLEPEAADGAALALAKGRFVTAPVIAFRWLKVPGESHGRSPVMKALPDIKTANKVVELVLKNASIAVTGIWQAEDDGVLNPANIRLVPGAIIPKAVGSAGLTPLEAPGRFDISDLMLEDLRARIRHALLVDRLKPIEGSRMTATEILERSAETIRLLGATFGRLQAELLTPLVVRATGILQRRGEIPDFRVDGREVALVHQSPLARAQAQADMQGAANWLQQVLALGPEAMATVDLAAAARWMAKAAGVPASLLKPEGEAGRV